MDVAWTMTQFPEGRRAQVREFSQEVRLRLDVAGSDQLISGHLRWLCLGRQFVKKRAGEKALCVQVLAPSQASLILMKREDAGP